MFCFFLYGIVISFMLSLSLKKTIAKYIKTKKFYSLSALFVIFIFALLLFLPALIGIKYFIISFISSVISNFFLLFINFNKLKK
jgi:hypothetical protein